MRHNNFGFSDRELARFLLNQRESMENIARALADNSFPMSAIISILYNLTNDSGEGKAASFAYDMTEELATCLKKVYPNLPLKVKKEINLFREKKKITNPDLATTTPSTLQRSSSASALSLTSFIEQLTISTAAPKTTSEVSDHKTESPSRLTRSASFNGSRTSLASEGAKKIEETHRSPSPQKFLTRKRAGSLNLQEATPAAITLGTSPSSPTPKEEERSFSPMPVMTANYAEWQTFFARVDEHTTQLRTQLNRNPSPRLPMEESQSRSSSPNPGVSISMVRNNSGLSNSPSTSQTALADNDSPVHGWVRSKSPSDPTPAKLPRSRYQVENFSGSPLKIELMSPKGSVRSSHSSSSRGSSAASLAAGVSALTPMGSGLLSAPSSQPTSPRIRSRSTTPHLSDGSKQRLTPGLG